MVELTETELLIKVQAENPAEELAILHKSLLVALEALTGCEACPDLYPRQREAFSEIVEFLQNLFPCEKVLKIQAIPPS